MAHWQGNPSESRLLRPRQWQQGAAAAGLARLEVRLPQQQLKISPRAPQATQRPAEAGCRAAARRVQTTRMVVSTPASPPRSAYLFHFSFLVQGSLRIIESQERWPGCLSNFCSEWSQIRLIQDIISLYG